MPFDDSGDISGELKNFIRRNIHSISLLEVLLFLKRNPLKQWTPEEISLEMRTNPSYAKSQLGELQVLKLVELESNGYIYSPRGLAETVDKLELVYISRRSTVTNYIYSQPIDSIRDFANAFKIKKD